MNSYIKNQNLYFAIGGISLIILLGSFGQKKKVYNILPLPLDYIPEQFHEVVLLNQEYKKGKINKLLF